MIYFICLIVAIYLIWFADFWTIICKIQNFEKICNFHLSVNEFKVYKYKQLCKKYSQTGTNRMFKVKIFNGNVKGQNNQTVHISHIRLVCLEIIILQLCIVFEKLSCQNKIFKVKGQKVKIIPQVLYKVSLA